MAMGRLGPIMTSILRLLVISFLFVANWVAIVLVLVYSKKKRGLQDVGRIVSVTILCANVMYLVLVWMPFTITSLRHDVLAADVTMFGADPPVPESITSETASGFVVEYIDLRNGNIISEETLTVDYVNDPQAAESENPKPFPYNQENLQNNTTDSDIEVFLKWNSFIQDMQTSACVYSLLLAAVARFLMSRKEVMKACRPLNVPICAVMLVIVPSLVTITIRYLTCTFLHYFPHMPDVSLADQTVYSLICDIHVTQKYVMVVLLEALALTTLAAALGAFGLRLMVDRKHVITSKDEETCKHHWPLKIKPMVNMEACTVDALLVVGCCWVWCKVILVLTLYYFYGPHWSSLVSWLSNVVVSIPVVFLPVAVIMSYAFRDITSYLDDLYLSAVITASTKCDDSENDKSQGKYVKSLQNETLEEVTDLTNYLTYGNDKADKKDTSSKSETCRDSDTTRENLKFYLGKDILKQVRSPIAKDDDTYIILDNEWPTAIDGDDHESKA